MTFQKEKFKTPSLGLIPAPVLAPLALFTLVIFDMAIHWPRGQTTLPEVVCDEEKRRLVSLSRVFSQQALNLGFVQQLPPAQLLGRHTISDSTEVEDLQG